MPFPFCIMVKFTSNSLRQCASKFSYGGVLRFLPQRRSHVNWHIVFWVLVCLSLDRKLVLRHPSLRRRKSLSHVKDSTTCSGSTTFFSLNLFTKTHKFLRSICETEGANAVKPPNRGLCLLHKLIAPFKVRFLPGREFHVRGNADCTGRVR